MTNLFEKQQSHIDSTRVIYLMAVVLLLMTAFVSCSKDGGGGGGSGNQFTMSDLYGTWDVTDIYDDYTGWINVRQYPEYQSSATFNPNGTYSGAGFFGYGNGTYTVYGNTIYTSLGISYDVIDFNPTKKTAEAIMDWDYYTIRIKIKKR